MRRLAFAPAWRLVDRVNSLFFHVFASQSSRAWGLSFIVSVPRRCVLFVRRCLYRASASPPAVVSAHHCHYRSHVAEALTPVNEELRTLQHTLSCLQFNVP